MNIKAYFTSVLLIVILVPKLAMANIAQSATTLSPLSYDSELAAVVAAVAKYNPRSIAEDREYIGAILENDGKYYYTVAEGQSGQETIQTKIRYSKKMTLHAFWHTHAGPGDTKKYFSDVDTRLVNELGKPLYMADYLGTLRVYRVGDRTMNIKTAQRLGLPAIKGMARGVVIPRELYDSSGA